MDPWQIAPLIFVAGAALWLGADWLVRIAGAALMLAAVGLASNGGERGAALGALLFVGALAVCVIWPKGRRPRSSD